MIDPMGRSTRWHTDVQSRITQKEYGDGSKVSYIYENLSGRLHQVVDEKGQTKQYRYNRDNTVSVMSYPNAFTATPAIRYSYDSDYMRRASMSDGFGLTTYAYGPITIPPNPGAGLLAVVDGPLPDDTLAYQYDALNRHISTTMNGVAMVVSHDPAGRVFAVTNALGSFNTAYDGASMRVASETFPNGQSSTRAYGNATEDFELQQITHKFGAAPISEFQYTQDVATDRIAGWSQQFGAAAPDRYTFDYDPVDQLLSATITNSGSLKALFAYTYDSAGNRLTEQRESTNAITTYNALNEISTTTSPVTARTNEWDAENRLVAVRMANERTEFAYDGEGRLTTIRHLASGVQTGFRRFVWNGYEIWEERDATGAVQKRFFSQGVKVEAGTNQGRFYYTRDHLGSVREIVDSNGTLRARYSYTPYGRRTRLFGDMEADFGFAGMFWSTEARLALTKYRAYDPDLGRWLSRDPLPLAEVEEGPNLFSYVHSDPVNRIDPSGLKDTSCCVSLELAYLTAQNDAFTTCQTAKKARFDAAVYCEFGSIFDEPPEDSSVPEVYRYYSREIAKYIEKCQSDKQFAEILDHYCLEAMRHENKVGRSFLECLTKGCKPKKAKCTRRTKH
jgi:RHS repeat-associated protein